jgi:parvulin-like peptidyl-prolyl isomerase
MRIFSTGALVSCLLVAAFGATAQELKADQANQVVARVGDETITAGEFARDLQFKVRQIESATGQKVNPDLRFRRALMAEIINNRILNIVARNSGTAVDDTELEKDFQERKGVFDSEEAYQGYLKRLNMTEDALKENVRSRLRVKNFVDQKTGELTASEEEIAKAYDTLKAQGKVNRTEDTRDVAVILMRAKGGSDEAWKAAEERAKAARTRIEAGETFDAVAREISEDPATAPRGGVLRELKVGSFYPELEGAMKGLKAGDIAGPVRSVMGWYLITILAENKPGVVPIESMHDLLHDQIIEGKRRAKVAEIVAEAQKLIRVEILEAPETPLAPAEPLTPPVPAPAVPEVPEGTAPVTPDSTPALPAPS